MFFIYGRMMLEGNDAQMFQKYFYTDNYQHYTAGYLGLAFIAYAETAAYYYAQQGKGKCDNAYQGY